MLYLHETIAIRGDGATRYMDGVLERARYSESAGISRLVGTWRVVGSTGRWPSVVNLWEMDGWMHWSRTLEQQFHPSARDPHLGAWWSRMTRYRHGGLDRILEPAKFSPTRSELVFRGTKGWVTQQERYRVAPPLVSALLEAVEVALVPWMQSRTLELVGAYFAPMRPGEVFVLWSAPDFAALCRWWEERGHCSAWNAWTTKLEEWGARVAISWLVPFPGTTLSPETRE
ncbi:MAG: hypothetical protein KatS3mg077_0708 [Candidatus Binatia bacterium]|nr:MAG: hypothetical protein KatS3mg077_0708 [Candidatus Binatia bacterium]